MTGLFNLSNALLTEAGTLPAFSDLFNDVSHSSPKASPFNPWSPPRSPKDPVGNTPPTLEVPPPPVFPVS